MLIKCNPDRRCWLSAGILLTTLLTGVPVLAQTGRLSLITGALPPFTTSPGQPGFLNELAPAVFKRLGIDVDVTTVPVERALINVNSGLDDGDLFRSAGSEAEYANLTRVPEKVLDFEFMAYVKRPDIRIRNWADLRPYSVAYTVGWKIFDRNVRDVKELTFTPSINELFSLLEKGRADVILLDRWQGQLIIRQTGYQVKPLEPPLARAEMFMYLNKKRAALVPRVAQALRDMKADGSYERIYDATLRLLDTR